MRKFASNYLSGRVKVKPPSEATSDRYDYLGLDQAEPNLGTSASQYALSFTNSDVNTTDNTITFASNHGLATGDKVVYDGSAAVSDVGSVTTGTTYYAIRVNDTVIKLATTKENATDGQVHALSAPGGAGTHYIGQTTLLTTTPTGSRKLVSLGEDLDLELVNGEYKIKFADGATQSIISETIDASDLQETTTAGNTSDVAVSFTNTTDATDIGTGAVSITGGLSVGKTLYMDDREKIIFKGDGDDYSESIIRATYDVSGANSLIAFQPGMNDVSATQTIYKAPTGTESDINALRINQNINYSTGKQISRIWLGGKMTSDTITGTDPVYSTPSESWIYSNPVLVLDPAVLGDATGKVVIKGDLEVQGTQTTINSTTLDVADLNIVVAKDATTSSATNTAGIIFGKSVGAPTVPAVSGEWNDSNLPPSIQWSNNATGSYLLSNKIIAASGFIHQDYIDDSVTGSGFLKSDGTIDTTAYATSDNNTLYEIDTNTANTSTVSHLLLNAVGGNSQVVEIIGDGGIGVSTAAATTNGGPGATPTLPKITIDGSSVTPITYALDKSYGQLQVTLSLTASNDQANPQLVKWEYSGNVNAEISSDRIKIDLDDSVFLQDDNARIRIDRLANTATNNIPSGADIYLDDLAVDAEAATHGVVGYFKRKEIAINPDIIPAGVNGGVIAAEVVADNNPNNAAWMTFLNSGTGKDNVGDRQGEITTKQSETDFLGNTTKSGIRIWGHKNIDFDVSSTESTPANTDSRRLSITEDGLVLRNYSEIIYDGTNFETYVQFVDPTADRTIAFPNASGTVALLADIPSSIGAIQTADDTSNEDQYIVFADEATTSAGVTQDPLTNSGLRFNPSTSSLSVSGDITITGTLSATSKSFLIDHPTKKDKKLQYASLEGPENGVYVRGKLENENVVLLPDYWCELIDEDSITVNITPIGQHQNIFVQSVSCDKIIIGGENVNCFYTVFAERKDIEKLVVEYEDL